MARLHGAGLVLKRSITRTTGELVIEAVVRMARIVTAGERRHGFPVALSRGLRPNSGYPRAGAGGTG